MATAVDAVDAAFGALAAATVRGLKLERSGWRAREHAGPPVVSPAAGLVFVTGAVLVGRALAKIRISGPVVAARGARR